MFGWGYNRFKQINNNNNNNNSSSNNNSLIHLECDFSRVLYLLSDGSVYLCGDNNGAREYNFKATYVACAWGLNVIVEDQTGKVFVWGSNTKLLNHFFQIEALLLKEQIIKPVHLNTMDIKISKVAIGETHVLMLAEDGVVYSLGDNQNGQLGVNDTTTRKSIQRVVWEGDENNQRNDIIDICCGGRHNLALSSCGFVYSWGWGAYLPLGHGGTEDELCPKSIDTLKEKNVFVTSIKCGFWHSVVLSKTHKVYAFGFNQHGQLANNTRKSNPFPEKIPYFSKREGGSSGTKTKESKKIISVACGSQSTVFLDIEGTVYASGYYKSETGNFEQLQPTKIELPTHLDQKQFNKVFSGAWTSFLACV